MQNSYFFGVAPINFCNFSEATTPSSMIPFFLPSWSAIASMSPGFHAWRLEEKKDKPWKLVRNGLAKTNYVFTNEFLAWFVSGSFSISNPHNLLEERAPAAAPMTPNDKPKPSCGFHPKALMFLTKPFPRRAPKAPTLVFTLKREYTQTEPRMKGGLLKCTML